MPDFFDLFPGFPYDVSSLPSATALREARNRLAQLNQSSPSWPYAGSVETDAQSSAGGLIPPPPSLPPPSPRGLPQSQGSSPGLDAELWRKIDDPPSGKPGGSGPIEWCYLMPGIQRFRFCLYLCPSGDVRRLDRGRLGCQLRIPRSGGLGPNDMWGR